MTRRHLTHNVPISQDRAWFGTPINPRNNLRMALYWQARQKHRNAIRPGRSTRGRLWDIAADRRLQGVIAINDQRHVVSGPYRRWEADNWKRMIAVIEPAIGEP